MESPLDPADPAAAGSVPFVFVDVFADAPLTGNPLALVPDAAALDDARMKAIAREFNQSETTFLVPPQRPEATWRLRSFTPIGVEVFGAGHNALGAWLWLAHTGRLSADTEHFTQQIGDEVLPVRVVRHGREVVVSMDQSAPVFGAEVHDRAALAASLGLSGSDLVPDAPAQVVDTGAGHLLVPVRDRSTVDRTVPDTRVLGAILREANGEGCYVYSRDPMDAAGGSVAYARFFNPTAGIVEDPATGTAAGPLVASLVAAGAVAEDVPAVVEQGAALGRPSRLQITVSGRRVRLSGAGIIAASGVLHLDGTAG